MDDLILNHESRSANQLSRWLKEVGIDNVALRHENGRVVLLIEDKNRQMVSVMPVPEETAVPPTIRPFPARVLRRGTQTEAVDAFMALTEELGYGKLNPIPNRPTIQKKRYVNFLDSSLKHREFVRSINPDQAIFERHRQFMYSSAGKFFNTNQDMCVKSGYEIDDIYSYCQCYLVQFETLFRLPDRNDDENDRLFNSYLKQRLYYLKICMSRHLKEEAMVAGVRERKCLTDEYDEWGRVVVELEDEESVEEERKSKKQIAVELERALVDMSLDKKLNLYVGLLVNPETDKKLYNLAEEKFEELLDTIMTMGVG